MALALLPGMSLPAEAASNGEEKASLTADDFIFTPPNDLIYDGQPKPATITPKEGIDCGAITLRYLNTTEKRTTDEATRAATYEVIISAAGSENYSAVWGLSDPSWTFTIGYGELTEEMYTITNITEDGWARNYVTIYAVDGLLSNGIDYPFWSGLNYNPPGNPEIYYKSNATGKVYHGFVNTIKWDTGKPVIEGLEDGKMYYGTAKTFTAIDPANEGEEASGVAKVVAWPNSSRNDAETITIVPEPDGTYKLPAGRWYYDLTAFDKAGNTSPSIDVAVLPCTRHDIESPSYVWNRDENGEVVSCTASGVCSVCNETVTETSTDLTFAIKSSQSCTEPEIARCRATFNEPAFNDYFETIETKPAAGHTLEKTEANNATCTEDGNKAYYTCTTCRQLFADAAAETEISYRDTVLPATGHSLEKVAAKAATCTEFGNLEYYKCTDCGLCFEDADGKTAVDEWDMKLLYKPHEGGTPVYNWLEHPNGQVTCVAVLSCRDCQTVLKREVGRVTSAITREPTCTEAGTRTYTASFTDSAFPAQTHDMDVNPLGHTPNEDDGDCTTPVTCVRCDHVFVAAKNHNWSETWEKDGSGHWHLCQNEGCTQLMKESHTPNLEAPTEDADQVCTECGWVIASRLGHIHKLHLEEVAAKAATCTEAGNKAYYKCTEDQKCFSDPNAETEVNESEMILPANGHIWADPVYTWSEDLTGCTAVQRCKSCDTVKESETSRVTSAVTQAQSCTEPELTTYTAAFASETFAAQKKVLETKPAAGHQPGEWIIDQPATPAAAGSQHKECTVCRQVLETTAIPKLPPIVYTVVEGANGTYTIHKNDTYTLRADGEFGKFVNVELDGTVVDSKYYTATSGSTVITFTKAYLEGLPVGQHTVRVNFTDGYAETTLTVARKESKKNAAETSETKDTAAPVSQSAAAAGASGPQSPATGDSSNLLLWLTVALVSAGALTLVGMRRKHRG